MSEDAQNDARIVSGYGHRHVKLGRKAMKPFEITPGVFQVGGPDMTASEDAAIYFVDLGVPTLIDTGSGINTKGLLRNLLELGYRPNDIARVILTHAHIDHIGGAHFLREKFEMTLAMHELDVPAVETADRMKTAATWYNLELEPTRIKEILKGEAGEFDAGVGKLHWLHTPGHTPGSIALWLEAGIYRVLFAQDVHGPFYDVFGSDLDAWADSMRKLIDLEPDILCEGHFGIYRPASEARRYIEDYLKNFGKMPDA